MRSQVAQKKAQHHRVFQTVENDSHLLDLLVIATSSAQKSFFINTLVKSLPDAFAPLNKEPEQLFSVFTTWFGNYKDANAIFTSISTALEQRQRYFLSNRFYKRQFITAIGLDWTSVEKELFFAQVPVIFLSKRDTPYPPPKYWVVESDTIDMQWRYHIEHGKQPDSRLPRYPLLRMDSERLQKDVGSDESVLILDERTHEIVMLILRNFTDHPALLDHIGNVIKRAVQYRRSMRVSVISKLFNL